MKNESDFCYACDKCYFKNIRKGAGGWAGGTGLKGYCCFCGEYVLLISEPISNNEKMKKEVLHAGDCECEECNKKWNEIEKNICRGKICI